MKNQLRKRSFFVLQMSIVIMVLFILGSSQINAKPKILVFAKTVGFHHNSIAVGLVAIQKLGAENNFGVDTTTDADKFTIKNLKRYKAVVFPKGTLVDRPRDQFFTRSVFTEDQDVRIRLRDLVDHRKDFVDGLTPADDLPKRLADLFFQHLLRLRSRLGSGLHGRNGRPLPACGARPLRLLHRVRVARPGAGPLHALPRLDE